MLPRLFRDLPEGRGSVSHRMIPVSVRGGRTRGRRARMGFTLVELLTVMLVIAVSSALVMPRLDWQGRQFRSGVVEVQSILVRAQRAAVLYQHNVVVRFDPTNRQISVQLDADNDGLAQDGEKVTVHALGQGIGFGRVGHPALAWGGEAVSFKDSQVTFYRDGSASATSGIYLSSSRRLLTGNYPAETVALEVIRSTGAVRCLSYVAPAWSVGCR